jgi:hypothetical protein
LGNQRLEDRVRTMAQDERAPGTDEVEVTVAVDVPDPRALTAGNERRASAHRAIGTDRAVDAAWNQALRLLE